SGVCMQPAWRRQVCESSFGPKKEGAGGRAQGLLTLPGRENVECGKGREASCRAGHRPRIPVADDTVPRPSLTFHLGPVTPALATRGGLTAVRHAGRAARPARACHATG